MISCANFRINSINISLSFPFFIILRQYFHILNNWLRSINHTTFYRTCCQLLLNCNSFRRYSNFHNLFSCLCIRSNWRPTTTARSPTTSPPSPLPFPPGPCPSFSMSQQHQQQQESNRRGLRSVSLLFLLLLQAVASSSTNRWNSYAIYWLELWLECGSYSLIGLVII